MVFIVGIALMICGKKFSDVMVTILGLTLALCFIDIIIAIVTFDFLTAAFTLELFLPGHIFAAIFIILIASIRKLASK